MITTKALDIPSIKTRIDDKSNSRKSEHGCRSYAGESDITSGYFTFSTQCQTSGNSYTQQIQFNDWSTIVPIEEIDPNTPLATLLQNYPDIMQLDVMVDCDCPAFSYWGHRYNLDMANSSIERSISPTVNNPDARISCKHLATVYDTFCY